MDDFYTPEQMKEEAYKCSKCALCKQICPAYKRTKNEKLLAKGRCIIIQGVLNNEVKLKRRYIKTFKECEGCNQCQSYCPSSIDMERLSKSIIKFYYDKHFIQKYFGEQIYKLSKGKFGLKP